MPEYPYAQYLGLHKGPHATVDSRRETLCFAMFQFRVVVENPRHIREHLGACARPSRPKPRHPGNYPRTRSQEQRCGVATVLYLLQITGGRAVVEAVSIILPQSARRKRRLADQISDPVQSSRPYPLDS